MLGTGTKSNPLIIETPQDLQMIGTSHLQANKFIELGNDLDMSNFQNFIPIGSNVPSTNRFKGSFDGKGYSIRNLKVESSTLFVGLFGYIDAGAIVTNLSIVEATVVGGASNSVCGILAGDLAGDATNIFTNGIVENSIGNRSGGIIGVIAARGNLADSYSTAKINGGKTSVGGLVGRVEHGRPEGVRNSCFLGTINSNAINIGGAVAHPIGTDFKFQNVFYNSDLVLLNNLSNFDTPLTSEQMRDSTHFTEFNSDKWTIIDGSFPYLTMFGEPVIPLPAKKTTVEIINHTAYIKSYSELARRKVQSVVTTTQSISQSLSREALAIAESMIENIVSNVEALENANIKTHIISSHISGIGSDASRMVKAIRSVESNIKPLTIVTELIIPVDEERPVYATVYIMENQTNASFITNKSEASFKQNATEMSVI